MKISVAVAVFNGEKFIEKQLNTILNQTTPVDEVVISDDCSTDNTFNICQEFILKNNLTNWKLLKNSKNLGFCFNFYNAIENCSGEVIFLADQDDEWYQNKTKIMLETLEKHPEIKVLASRYDVIDQNSNILENTGIPYLGEKFDDTIEYLPTESFIGCSYIRGFSMCFRKEILKYFKPLQLKSLLAHDWLFCMLGNVEGKTAVLNTKLTAYRYHTNNVSLSDMTRKTLIGDRDKRLNGLKESIEAHKYISNFFDNKNIEKFVKFEEKRLKFLQNKNLFLWFSLSFYLKQYSRYYKGNALRVYLGDFAYAYNLKFKINKKIWVPKGTLFLYINLTLVKNTKKGEEIYATNKEKLQ